MPFHPAAQYGDDARDAAEYATRAPLPIIHLLRDADVRCAPHATLCCHISSLLTRRVVASLQAR